MTAGRRVTGGFIVGDVRLSTAVAITLMRAPMAGDQSLAMSQAVAAATLNLADGRCASR